MRKFSAALAALSAALTLGHAADAQAAGAKVLKLSNGLPETHPAILGAKKFGELLAQKTNGRYEVQVYPNATLGDDVRATEAVRMGTLEMVSTSSSPLTGLVPELAIFDLPFLITSEAAADAVYDGAVGAKLAAALEPKGLVLLAYYENGFRQLTNSVREVKSPADMKGLKIRTMQNPMHLDAFKALGANPTPMPFSEVFTAMQQKTIDGQENPIPTIYLSKYNEVQKYVSLTGHIYGPHLILINKKLFESFPEADRKIIKETAQESARYERQLNRKYSADLVAELKKSGMVVTALSADQKKAFQDACAPVYATWEPKIGKPFVDEVKATVAKAK